MQGFIPREAMEARGRAPAKTACGRAILTAIDEAHVSQGGAATATLYRRSMMPYDGYTPITGGWI